MVIKSVIMDEEDDLEALRLAALQTIRPRVHTKKTHLSQNRQVGKAPFLRPSTNPNLIAIVPTEALPIPVETSKARFPQAAIARSKHEENRKQQQSTLHSTQMKEAPKLVDSTSKEEKLSGNLEECGFELEEDVLDFDTESLHESAEEDLLQLHDSDSDSLEKLMEDIEKELSAPVQTKPRAYRQQLPPREPDNMNPSTKAKGSNGNTSTKPKSPLKTNDLSKPKSPPKVESTKSDSPKPSVTYDKLSPPRRRYSPLRQVSRAISPGRRVHSPRRSPPLRRRSPSPRKRSLSPRRHSPTPRKRSLTPRRRSPTPRRRSPSPLRKRSLTPRKRSLTPRKRSLSPRKRSLTPRKRSLTPRKRSLTPRRRSLTPRKRSLTPRKRSLTPRKRSITPRKRSLTPRKRSLSPRRRTPSPRKRSLSPRRRSVSPRRFSPRRRSISPRRRRSISPRRRSLSPWRSPRRRSPTPGKRSPSPQHSPNKRKRPLTPPNTKRARQQRPFTRNKPATSNNSNRLIPTTKGGYRGNRENSEKKEEDRKVRGGSREIIRTRDRGAHDISEGEDRNGEPSQLSNPKLEARKRKFGNNYIIESVNKKIRLKSEREEGSVESENIPSEASQSRRHVNLDLEALRADNGRNTRAENSRTEKLRQDISRAERARILDSSRLEKLRIDFTKSDKTHFDTGKVEKARLDKSEKLRSENSRPEPRLEANSLPNPDSDKESKLRSTKRKRIVLAEDEAEEFESREATILKETQALKNSTNLRMRELEENDEVRPEEKRKRKGREQEKGGGDLRAELSRRRAERMKGASLDPMARIVQSAIEGAVGKMKTKSRASPPSDNEVSPRSEKKSRPKGRRVFSVSNSSKAEDKKSDDDEKSLGLSMHFRGAANTSPPRTSGRSILRRNQV